MDNIVSMLSWRAVQLWLLASRRAEPTWTEKIQSTCSKSHQPNQQNSNIPPPKPRQSSVTTAVAKRLIKKINKWSKLVSLAMRYTSTPQNFFQPALLVRRTVQQSRQPAGDFSLNRGTLLPTTWILPHKVIWGHKQEAALCSQSHSAGVVALMQTGNSARPLRSLTHRNQNSCWCFIIHIMCNNSSNFHIHSFYLSFYSHYIYTDKG